MVAIVSRMLLVIGVAGLVINTLWHGNNWWLGTEAFFDAIFALIFGIGMGIKIGGEICINRIVRHAKLATPREIDECVERVR